MSALLGIALGLLYIVIVGAMSGKVMCAGRDSALKSVLSLAYATFVTRADEPPTPIHN